MSSLYNFFFAINNDKGIIIWICGGAKKNSCSYPIRAHTWVIPVIEKRNGLSNRKGKTEEKEEKKRKLFFPFSSIHPVTGKTLTKWTDWADWPELSNKKSVTVVFFFITSQKKDARKKTQAFLWLVDLSIMFIRHVCRDMAYAFESTLPLWENKNHYPYNYKLICMLFFLQKCADKFFFHFGGERLTN